MHQRVACQGQGRFGRPCGAHRDLTLSRRCPYCRSTDYQPVPPTKGDLDACYANLSRWAGELVSIRPTDDVLALIDTLDASSRCADAEQPVRLR